MWSWRNDILWSANQKETKIDGSLFCSDPNYMLWYGTKFNENKSVVLNFKGYKFKANPSAKLYINGSLMKTDMSYTYLGHIINNNLNDNKDIERQLRNFYGKTNMSLRAVGSYSYAVKLQWFMSYCGSMYTAFLLCDFTKGNSDNWR